MGGKRKTNTQRGTYGYEKKYKSRDLDVQSVTSSTKSDQEMKVDKILDRRILRGKTEYLCSWRGLGSYEETWEREDELDCEDLIDNFNDSLLRFKVDDYENGNSSSMTRHQNGNGTENGNGRESTTSSSDKYNNRISGSKSTSNLSSKNSSASLTGTGFDKGLQADFILGHSTSDSGERMFLVKWKDSDDADMVPARLANKRCPHLVISFFESRTELRDGQLIFR